MNPPTHTNKDIIALIGAAIIAAVVAGLMLAVFGSAAISHVDESTGWTRAMPPASE